MRWLYTLPLRLRSIFQRSRLERELNNEFQFHLDRRIEQLVASGLTPEEARSAARRDMDGLDQRKEECREARGIQLLDDFVRDALHGLRGLRRYPSFSLAALTALALGIGANTAVFSVVNSVLLRPLPYPDSDRLVVIYNSRPDLGIERAGASIADFLDWRARAHSFDSIQAINVNRFTLTGDGDAENVIGMNVTAGFFDLLSARPLIGRAFQEGDDDPGRTPTVVLSERLWKRRYGSDRNLPGRSIMVNGRPHTVVGVMPAGVEFGPDGVDLWAILTLNPPTRRGPFATRGLARLKPGVTIEQASREMELVAQQVQRENARDYATLHYPLERLQDSMVGRIERSLWLLSATVLLVLFSAVFNVANLILARAAARGRETAIRLSIGAGRGRLFRQYLTESIILGVAGGLGGVLIAFWGIQMLRTLGPADLPRLNEITIDATVLSFTMLVSLFSAICFGIAPAIAATASRAFDSLRTRTISSPAQARLRASLVIAQVTLSMFLLVGAGLLLRSFSLLTQVPPGFDAEPERVLTMSLRLNGPGYRQPAAVNAYWRRLTETLSQLPGVTSTGIALTLPPDRLDHTDMYEIEGRPSAPGSRWPAIPVQVVSPGFFSALGVPLLRGRLFDHRDTAQSPRVAIISDAFARKHFPNEDPIGRRMRYGGDSLEIIGVVGDVKYQGLARPHEPVFYNTNEQWPARRAWLLLRTEGNPELLVPAVRRVIRDIDPAIPIDRLSTMADALSASVALPRFRSLLMGGFAAVAVLLSATGIYGLIAFSVAQRRLEIGIRMALGATRSRILVLVLKAAGRLTAAGIAMGLAAAWIAARSVRQMLYGIQPSDGVTFVGAAAVLTLAALAAALLPASRAARVDPALSLRHD